MICLDKPRDYGGRFNGCSHLFSDTLDQAAAQAELLDFARRAGLDPRWIQHAGTYRVHFDVFGAGRRRCVALGAQLVTDKQAVTIWRAQKAPRAWARRAAQQAVRVLLGLDNF